MSSGVGEFHPRALSKSSEFAAFAVVLVRWYQWKKPVSCCDGGGVEAAIKVLVGRDSGVVPVGVAVCYAVSDRYC